MPEEQPSPPQTSTPAIADVLALFLRTLLEAFRPAGDGALAYRRKVQAEWEQHTQAEDAIKRRYANAWYHDKDIRHRAEEHGVLFSHSATWAHRAAILDFLDNPDAATLLDSMHMTWFWGEGADGRSTATRTHPVNRAVYTWSAHDVAAMRPYGIASADAALTRLRTIHYPLARATWTTAQWAAYEDAGGALASAPHISVSRPSLPSAPIRGAIPVKL